jgi:transcriptional antiterminator NusG
MRIDELNETNPTPDERDLEPSEPVAADPMEDEVSEAAETGSEASVGEETVGAADPIAAETEVAEPEPEVTEPEPDVVEPVEPEPEPEEPTPAEPDMDLVQREAEQDLGVEPAAEEPEVEALVVDVAPAAEAEPTEQVEPAPVEAGVAEVDGDAGGVEEEAPPAVRDEDPFRGHGDWYVVHTYSGYENKVKANLESRIHTMQMEGKIFGVHIPMEDVMEIKSGKKQVVKKKQFPGYLLVRMIYDNDSWYVVRNTPGVTGFVSAGTGSKPTPLSKHEVEKILAVKKEEVRPQVRLGFEEGDVVRITSGPFADFNGTIHEINPDQAKLKVLVNIFDRETPVELSFDQVSKV